MARGSLQHGALSARAPGRRAGHIFVRQATSPAIKAGTIDDAKAIAKGIQAEHLGKMKQLLAELGAK